MKLGRTWIQLKSIAIPYFVQHWIINVSWRINITIKKKDNGQLSRSIAMDFIDNCLSLIIKLDPIDVDRPAVTVLFDWRDKVCRFVAVTLSLAPKWIKH